MVITTGDGAYSSVQMLLWHRCKIFFFLCFCYIPLVGLHAEIPVCVCVRACVCASKKAKMTATASLVVHDQAPQQWWSIRLVFQPVRWWCGGCTSELRAFQGAHACIAVAFTLCNGLGSSVHTPYGSSYCIVSTAVLILQCSLHCS